MNKMSGALAPEKRPFETNRSAGPDQIRRPFADYFARSANIRIARAAAVKTSSSRNAQGVPPTPPHQPLCNCASVQRPAHQPRFISLLGIFAIAASSPLAAQQSKPWEKIPIPPLHEFHPQQPNRIELKNGIVVFLQEDHELPFVSGSVLIPGGD
ncbi:MAG: hypothetical protein WBE74_00840, partial [Terracidiphilus sp.]